MRLPALMNSRMTVVAMMSVATLLSGCLDLDPGHFIRDAGTESAGVFNGLACVHRCKPNAPSCEGNNRVTYRLAGCDEAVCQFLPVRTACSGACVNGACENEPCKGAQCDAPPVATCSDAHSLRAFVNPGACVGNGQCAYPTVEFTCQKGCLNGQCIDQPCLGLDCSTPPPTRCAGNAVRTFGSGGTCSDVTGCTFPSMDIVCEFGCADGQCRAAVEDAGTGGGSAGGGTSGGGSTGGGSAGGGSAGGGSAGGGSAGGGSTGGGATGGGSPSGGGTGACGSIDAGAPTIRRVCVSATANECDGVTDTALQSSGASGALNSTSGNGFDDDCDGLVDEGCSCTTNGTVKDCYLVPATQTDAQGRAVGWCASNAKGTVDCAGTADPHWSGICRGALAPALSDSCGPGDFNCDGLEGNSSTTGCSCAPDVVCPTTQLVLPPFPPTTALPLLDGSAWFPNVATVAQTTDWSWTIVGGDCDNVLPNPTFAIYNSLDSTLANTLKGVPTGLAASQGKYVVMPTSLMRGVRANAYGNGLAGSRMYPAFMLSGDYVVQGEFTLNGTRRSCTQKVSVRGPGIRAELCWPNVRENDLDLHFARLQGITCTSAGWDQTCSQGNTTQDCSYLPATGCVQNSTVPPGWGYPDSLDSACMGWGSLRFANRNQACTNPRVDKQADACLPNVTDPTDSNFCGPENTNLDNPHDGDAFVIGVNDFGHNTGSTTVRPHVNIYCNGERRLSIGNNPLFPSVLFPVVDTAGGTSGDFWTVARVTAHLSGATFTSCDVEPIPSHHEDASRDGPAITTGAGNQACVDHLYSTRKFVENMSVQGLPVGSQPMTAPPFCKH